MPQSHSDHGVAAQRHWLLDEELASQSKGRASTLGSFLRREDIVPVAVPTIDEAAIPPRPSFVFLLAGLIAALVVYALLASVDGGSALEEVFSGDNQGTVRVTASLDEPTAGELAQLHALLASTPAATVERPRTSESPSKHKKSKGAGPREDDPVLLPLWPPPPPLNPEISLPEIPGVPELSALEVTEIQTIEVPPVTDLFSPEPGSQLPELL